MSPKITKTFDSLEEEEGETLHKFDSRYVRCLMAFLLLLLLLLLARCYVRIPAFLPYKLFSSSSSCISLYRTSSF